MPRGRVPTPTPPIHGIVYPSAKAAAAALGLANGRVVTNAIRLNQTDALGKGSEGNKPKPLPPINGVIYTSAEAAAAALGLGLSTVYRYVHQARANELRSVQRRRSWKSKHE